MKLSDAIRLGAMLHPQCFEVEYQVNGAGDVIRTCAIGAAVQAGYDARLLQDRTWYRCPNCGIRLRQLEAAITHLNDTHEWRRERIADWVELIERLAPPLAPGCGGLEDVDHPVPAPRV